MTGTDINYYFLCKRKCYLSHFRIGLEEGYGRVEKGKALHDSFSDFSEIAIDSIRLDELTDDYVIEKKSTHANRKGAVEQLLFYLSELEKKGIYRKGCLVFLDDDSQEFVQLTQENRIVLNRLKLEIEQLFSQKEIPDVIQWDGCKHCAYYDFCFC